MKEFFVGLLVLLALLVLGLAGTLLLPLIVVMGFFLKWVIAVALIIFSIWVLGKVSLMSIEWLKNKKG